jgi:hypothetical protein
VPRRPAGARHAQPDCSSASRNSCRTKGWLLPASAFQLAASMSAMLFRNRAREPVTRGRRRARRAMRLETFQIFIGIERGHAAGAGRGDGLAIHMVGDVAGGEHARQLVAWPRRRWPPLTTM